MLSWDAPFSTWGGMLIGDKIVPREALFRPNQINFGSERVSLRFSWDHVFEPSSQLIALRARYPAPER